MVIKESSIVIILSSLLLEMLAYQLLIPFFKRLKVGQQIRKEGPKSHYTKKGTPTMGGSVFICFFLVTTLVVLIFDKSYGNVFNYQLLLILFTTLAYAVLGFYDDYLIVVKKSNKGIKAQTKFIIQLVIASIVYAILLHYGHSQVLVVGNLQIKLGFGYGIFVLVLLASTSNAVNLTDGLDGLASSVMLISLGTLLAYGLINENGLLVLVSLTALLSLGIFLLFNAHPALIFMGNTGSMALGALLGILCIIYKIELLLLIIGFVFMVETVSVILQVSYFKITKGKRLFKMTPLHHHFELLGWSEYKIVIFFCFIQIVVVLICWWIGVEINWLTKLIY